MPPRALPSLFVGHKLRVKTRNIRQAEARRVSFASGRVGIILRYPKEVPYSITNLGRIRRHGAFQSCGKGQDFVLRLDGRDGRFRLLMLVDEPEQLRVRAAAPEAEPVAARGAGAAAWQA